jgi:hypothetical protein
MHIFKHSQSFIHLYNMYKLFIYFQISFILGLSFVFGLKRTYEFVFQKDNLRATAFTMGGIFIVLLGRPVIGMCVEILGFSLLHRYVLVLHLRVRVMTAHFLAWNRCFNKKWWC